MINKGINKKERITGTILKMKLESLLEGTLIFQTSPDEWRYTLRFLWKYTNIRVGKNLKIQFFQTNISSEKYRITSLKEKKSLSRKMFFKLLVSAAQPGRIIFVC